MQGRGVHIIDQRFELARVALAFQGSDQDASVAAVGAKASGPARASCMERRRGQFEAALGQDLIEDQHRRQRINIEHIENGGVAVHAPVIHAFRNGGAFHPKVQDAAQHTERVASETLKGRHRLAC